MSCHAHLSTFGAKFKSNLQLISIFVGIVVGFVVAFPLRRAELDIEGPTFFWIKIWGDVFLRLLHLLMVPLVVFSIINGVSTLNPKSSGKLGILTFTYILTTNGLGALVGLLSGSLLMLQRRAYNASSNHTEDDNGRSSSGGGGDSSNLNDIFADLIHNTFPKNLIFSCFQRYSGGIAGNVAVDGTNYLGLITFSLIVGVAISSLDKMDSLKSLVGGIVDVVFRALNGIMWTAPLGVCSLIVAGIASVRDLESAMSNLLYFVLVCLLGLSLYLFLFLPLLSLVLTRKSPREFMKAQVSVFFTGFAMQSSALTLPALFIASENDLRLSSHVTRFALPLCAMINRDGSNVFMGAACVFVAEFVGAPLGAADGAVVWLLLTILSMCGAAVPSSSIIVILLIFSSMGIDPHQVIGLLYSVDWLLDRIRTGVNCVSHALCAYAVHHAVEADVNNNNNDEDRDDDNNNKTSSSNSVV